LEGYKGTEGNPNTVAIDRRCGMSNYTKRITFLEEAWVVKALDEQVEAAQKQGLNIARSDVIRRLLRKGLSEQQEAKE